MTTNTAQNAEHTTTSVEPAALTVDECALIMGVTPRFIRELIWTDELPAYRLGKRLVRIKRDDLLALLTPIDSTREPR
jgi:excisionase family DNA binding protein